MKEKYEHIIKDLDDLKQLSNKKTEYWMARDIQNILGYRTWENFENVIERARVSCESAGVETSNHFLDTTKKVTVGSGSVVNKKDCFLSRYACYLVAMSGDTSKVEIAIAQTYFAVQTRLKEIEDKLTEKERRIYLRQRVKDANKKLVAAAKDAGVQRYGIFHDAGYRGLYDMGLNELKTFKGLDKKDDLLDHSGRTELAANEFRITQTEDKLIREEIKGEQNAINTHKTVGKEVRETIKKIGGTMPEHLTLEESIKKLEKGKKKPEELT